MSGTMPVANAPVSFGVDEIIVDDAWMPDPMAVIDMIAELGYEGTELGPPGYFGDPGQVRERLSARGLELVGSFLPLRLSKPEHAEEDRAWLRATLDTIRASAPHPERTIAILSDGFDSAERMRFAGRIPQHPEAWLPPQRWPVLVDNLHRAAEICREGGFRVAIHPHAGTYLETVDEIRRLLDAIDPSLVGLCLDTGHARFGGADPVRLVEDYHDLITHVHVKDCRVTVLNEVAREGLGMEDALVRGAFVELGAGDSGIGDVIAALQRHGYRGWLVVEQDRFLFASDTLDTLRQSQRRNRDFLRRLGI